MNYTKEEEQEAAMDRFDALAKWFDNNPEKEAKLISYTIDLFKNLPLFQEATREKTMMAIVKTFVNPETQGSVDKIFYETPITELEREYALEVYPEENTEEQIAENVGYLRAHSLTMNCEW